jgi:streptogramin lyase
MRMSRRTFLAATGGTLAASALPVPAAAATVTELGIPLSDVLLIGGAVGPGPNGRPALWSAASGEPAHLVSIDPRTAKTLTYQALDGAPGSYGVAIGPDGTVWVGAYNTGQLYRRKPGKNSPVENLGRPLPTETYIWRLVVDSCGVVFGCTYPNAKVFAYYPDGTIRDYGTILPGVSYARSIAEYGSKLYVGTQPDPHVVEIDKTSGAIRELPLPAGVGLGQTVYDLNAYDGRVYARFGVAITGKLGIWDIRRKTWGPLLDNVAGLDVSAPGPGGLVYYTRNGQLTALRPDTGKETPTGLSFAGRVVSNRGIGWVNLPDRDWPGRTLVGLLWRGEMFRYNPRTRKSDVRLTDVKGEPIPLASLSVGATGRLWAGGYLNGGLAQVDPGTGASTFHRFAQTESVLDLGSTIWLGTYPDSRLYRYDPALSWNSPEYSPGSGPENPVKVVDLKDIDQVRARTSVDAGDHVAYGTMPNTTLGGALVIVDKASNAAKIHRPVVTDQSIVALAYADGLIIGGTTIYGGYSVPAPTQTEAKLFGFDIAADTKVFETDVPGAKTVDGLVSVGSEIWGLAGGKLFAFDVASRTITRQVAVPSGAGRLAYHAGSDSFYVLASNTLVRVARSTLAVTTVVQRTASFLAVHPDGRVFLGNTATIYRVD